MRTTVEIDPDLLAEAMRLCEAKTKKEVIHTSLAELIRRHRIEELKAMAGTLAKQQSVPRSDTDWPRWRTRV